MKKTFNINVAGFPFTINDDAYALLSDYLETIEHSFRNMEEAQEIIADIESRVAELLLERTADGSPIVTAEDVENVIRRIGKPEDMIYDDETIRVEINNGNAVNENETFRGKQTPPPFNPSVPPVIKKLFRDPQDSMLGGVCSGLAHYIGCDPTWVRLTTVLITIISFCAGAVAYIVLWIVIPEAKTPIQRMQMMGEEPTMENIGKTVTDTFKEEKGENMGDRPVNDTSFAGGLAKMFGIIAKILLFFGLLIGIPLLIAMIVGLVGCIFALIMFCSTEFYEVNIPWLHETEGQKAIWGIICGIGAIFAIGAPLYLLLRKGLSKNRKPNSTTTNWTLGILCGLGFLTAAISVGKLISINEEAISSRRWHKHYDNKTEWVDEWEEVNSSEIREDFPADTITTDSLAKITVENDSTTDKKN